MLKSEGCKRASRSNMIPISNFFPLSRFIFFSPFFLYLFVLVVSTRERCILETSIDALEKRIASIHHYSDWCTINSAMYAHTATTSGHRRRVNCNFSNCTLLSSVCNTFRDSWRTRCAKGTWFPSIEFYRRWKYWKHFRLPRTPHSFENSALYYNGRRFQVWLAFLSCFIFLTFYYYYFLHLSFSLLVFYVIIFQTHHFLNFFNETGKS